MFKLSGVFLLLTVGNDKEKNIGKIVQLKVVVVNIIFLTRPHFQCSTQKLCVVHTRNFIPNAGTGSQKCKDVTILG